MSWAKSDYQFYPVDCLGRVVFICPYDHACDLVRAWCHAHVTAIMYGHLRRERYESYRWFYCDGPVSLLTRSLSYQVRSSRVDKAVEEPQQDRAEDKVWMPLHQWISVKDKNPEEYGEYLGSTRARPSGWVFAYAPVGWISADDYPVTHWMPLPDPPCI